MLSISIPLRLTVCCTAVHTQLYLGFIELPEAIEMVRHYFGGYRGVVFEETAREQLTSTWQRVEAAGIQLTPAQLEQLCSEFETVTDLVDGLKRMCGAMAN